ncbi:Uncharacterised protein [Vibrio cholerae]|nr:Uncharacterised protein [Vibrio cholerae]CSB93838.1 Uncharacterised protein [Vibrio cholerae]
MRTPVYPRSVSLVRPEFGCGDVAAQSAIKLVEQFVIHSVTIVLAREPELAAPTDSFALFELLSASIGAVAVPIRVVGFVALALAFRSLAAN